MTPASPLAATKKDRGLDRFILDDLVQKEQELSKQSKGNYAVMKRSLDFALLDLKHGQPEQLEPNTPDLGGPKVPIAPQRFKKRKLAGLAASVTPRMVGSKQRHKSCIEFVNDGEDIDTKS